MTGGYLKILWSGGECQNGGKFLSSSFTEKEQPSKIFLTLHAWLPSSVGNKAQLASGSNPVEPEFYFGFFSVNAEIAVHLWVISQLDFCSAGQMIST